MNRSLAIVEWRRAELSQRAASACLRHYCYADAVSRAYYAVFHAAKAALAFHDGTSPEAMAECDNNSASSWSEADYLKGFGEAKSARSMTSAWGRITT